LQIENELAPLPRSPGDANPCWRWKRGLSSSCHGSDAIRRLPRTVQVGVGCNHPTLRFLSLTASCGLAPGPARPSPTEGSVEIFGGIHSGNTGQHFQRKDSHLALHRIRLSLVHFGATNNKASTVAAVAGQFLTSCVFPTPMTLQQVANPRREKCCSSHATAVEGL